MAEEPFGKAPVTAASPIKRAAVAATLAMAGLEELDEILLGLEVPWSAMDGTASESTGSRKVAPGPTDCPSWLDLGSFVCVRVWASASVSPSRPGWQAKPLPLSARISLTPAPILLWLLPSPSSPTLHRPAAAPSAPACGYVLPVDGPALLGVLGTPAVGAGWEATPPSGTSDALGSHKVAPRRLGSPMAGKAPTPLGVGMMIVSSKFTVGPSGDVWALWCPLDSAGAAIGGESANE